MSFPVIPTRLDLARITWNCWYAIYLGSAKYVLWGGTWKVRSDDANAKY